VRACSRAFLVASSRWNQAAGADECLCRLSEIEDWEEGGRTELHHVQRIFGKEREEGSSRVLAVMRRVSPAPSHPRSVAAAVLLNRPCTCCCCWLRLGWLWGSMANRIIRELSIP
jgi:hypothetical protein